MKQTLFFLLAASGILSAQTITKAFNDPTAGDSPNYFTVNGTIDNSATGSGATFNNPSVTQGAASPTTYSTPTSSEISTYPGSTLKMVGSGNTIFFKQSASLLEITGLVTPDATLNFSTDNGTYIAYPTVLGTTTNDTASGTFTSSIANGNFTGTINILADASGTLIIGAKTYTNVLRVKSVQTFYLIINGIPLATLTNTAYFYYNGSQKYPLLSYTSANLNSQVLNINQTTTGAQALSETFLAAHDNTIIKKEGLKIYPNPAQDFIEFKGHSDNYSTAKIYSLDGKLVKTSDINSGKVQVSDLPAASYFIEVSGKDNKKPEASKFIKK
ncbi:Por secretion system C-terminal sorting domain-containing protein [Chryseobacterium arachidis]|uniref:Por secretion system C-terminal sorting domain-containing protein n=1 Tax=Chryseobacterium arachidis TaxID=1416778 RepID=A0A1M5A2V0_9FLAO|nr:T9SS type A sorting domain-containing protein [Chryseobacterium arachidis]SHF24162.1 Por secretion system C-terminal sorting domain-containing protein [Chryseobacterium arachidis]